MEGHSVTIYKLISSDTLITVYSCIVRETTTVCVWVCVRASPPDNIRSQRKAVIGIICWLN